jgi:hypothetical protein
LQSSLALNGDNFLQQRRQPGRKSLSDKSKYTFYGGKGRNEERLEKKSFY